jgi:NAD(P)-dependent dehydrogenase (short-subunit alcohol dehydrogenase family)
MKLENRIAIVTGGSSGIGRGIALEFAREGARVAVADIRENPRQGKYHEQDTVSTTVSEIEALGGESIFVQTDLADEAAVTRLLETTVKRFGGVDILVNNAGIHIPGNSQEISMDDWDRVTGLNLRGVFLAIKVSVPYLRKSDSGRIINISSIHAFAGGAGPAYASAKAAVANLSRDIALEVASDSVTVNTICPGYIETAMQDYLTEEDIEACRQGTPLPRFGLPRDIGRAAVFFASDDASWITGASLTVDGGWMASV